MQGAVREGRGRGHVRTTCDLVEELQRGRAGTILEVSLSHHDLLEITTNRRAQLGMVLTARHGFTPENAF